jgi:hypothetical protein
MKHVMQLSMIVGAMLMTQLTSGQATFGANAGVSFADVTVNGLNLGMGFLEPRMIVAPKAGVYAEFPLGNGLVFAPELDYTQKGFRVKESTNVDVFGLNVPIGAEAITRLDYLDMPLLLKYQFGTGRVRGYLKAGPTLGYAVDGKVTTRLNSVIDIKIAEIPLNTQGTLYNAFEVGGLVGAGIEVPTVSGKFFVDASFSQGFSDIMNEPVIDLRVKNRALGVGIGYSVRF